MQSISDLNNYGNSTVVFVDYRDPACLFNLEIAEDITYTASSGSFPLQNSVEITGFVRPLEANTKYIINVSSLPGTTVTWPNLPPGCTVSESMGVYTLNGIFTVETWNAVKNPIITIPSTFMGSFFYSVTIRWFDSANYQTKTWDVGNYVPVSNFVFLTNLQCDIKKIVSSNAILPTIVVASCTALKLKRFTSTENSNFTGVFRPIKTAFGRSYQYSNFTQVGRINYAAKARAALATEFTETAKPLRIKQLSSNLTAFAAEMNIGLRIRSTSVNMTATASVMCDGVSTTIVEYLADMQTMAAINTVGIRAKGLISNQAAAFTTSTVAKRYAGLASTQTSIFTIPTAIPKRYAGLFANPVATSTITTTLTPALMEMKMMVIADGFVSSEKVVSFYLAGGPDTTGLTTFTIDWGDGTVENIQRSKSANYDLATASPVSHTYASYGTYTVKLDLNTGTPFYFHSPSRHLKEISTFHNNGLASLNYAFAHRLIGNNRLTYVQNHPHHHATGALAAFYNQDQLDCKIDNLNASQITDMSGMFYNVSFPLFQNNDQNFTNWNTSKVRSMANMFQGVTFDEFNSLGMSNWDTHNVTNMDAMFYESWRFHEDLSNWDVRKITTEPALFYPTGYAYQDYEPKWGTSPLGQTYRNYTFTPVGDVQLSTAQKKWGTASAYMTSGRIDIANTKPYYYDSDMSDFTWEAWLRPTTANGTILELRESLTNDTSRQFRIGLSSGKVQVSTSDVFTNIFPSTSNTWALNTWNHMMITKVGTTYKLYKNGVLTDTATLAGDWYCKYATIGSSRNSSAANPYNGYIDDLRISSIARPVAVNTAKHLNDLNTLLLMHFDGANASTTFVDDNVLIIIADKSFAAMNVTIGSIKQGSKAMTVVSSIVAFVGEPLTYKWDSSKSTSMDFNVTATGLFKIDFGDGNTLVSSTSGNRGYALPYSTQPFTVKVIGNVTNFTLEKVPGLTEVSTFGDLPLTRLDGICSNSTSLVSVPTKIPKTVTLLSSTFSGCTAFNSPNVKLWNTANVTGMTNMFQNATTFNQDLSGWCVTLISTKPTGFDTGATAWTLPKPVWGTCPA